MCLTIGLLISGLLQASPEASPLGGDYGEPRVVVAAPENPRYAHLS